MKDVLDAFRITDAQTAELFPQFANREVALHYSTPNAIQTTRFFHVR